MKSHTLVLHIDENKIFTKLHSAKLFSTLNVTSGYSNITMAGDTKNTQHSQLCMENMSVSMSPYTNGPQVTSPCR